MPSPPNLNLFTSNRLEILSVFLSEILKTPLSSPFTPEIVVVQSKGMERWISMEIANRHGVCANISFPFPNPFVYEHVFRNVLPDIPDSSPFDRETMTWKIMGWLPALAHQPEFEDVRHYLGSERNDLKCLQLARKIAYTFDQYLLYRPEMIMKWQSGEDDGWQAILWRKVAEGNEAHHAPALRRAFLSRMDDLDPSPGSLPERVAVFGVSTLPPFHLEIFNALSRFCEVNLFIMNPCPQPWGDVLSGRKKRAIEKKAGDLDRGLLHLDVGNPLLAVLGELGRDFFDRLAEMSPQEESAFIDPVETDDSLLAMIQSDILNLREVGGADDEPRDVDPSDDAIRIHICHGPMREIEVLHDHLLDLFQNDPDLRPRDVLVMMPDIETYGPYVQAVFDRPRNDPRRIPFSIADRSFRSESRIVDAFLRILDLLGGRYEAATVLAILETPAVRARFDLTASDLDRIRTWIVETRIRWGIDAENRRDHGLPGFSENTWRAGLDRLLLGAALPGGGERMFQSILPYDAIEGEETETLGRFITFCERIFEVVEGFKPPRDPGRWAEDLLAAVDALFRPEDDAETEFRALRQALRELADASTRAGFDGDVDFQAIRDLLQNRLGDQGFGYGFITGGVTFCKTLPMRSIPFPVICMVGMNGDISPRRDTAPGFDLIFRKPRPGDRSARGDDRYLFLESILSARKKLYISYVGQSIRDNSVIPPSVLVSELVDYIRKGFTTPDGDLVDDHVLTRHRLQGFNPAYFDASDDARLFSYSGDRRRTARSLASPRQDPKPFFRAGLSPAGDERRTLSVDDLASFLCNPARYLLNRRLGIRLGGEDEALEETEPFMTEGLEKYWIEQALVDRMVRGGDGDDLLRLESARGNLPHGMVGRCAFDKLRRGAADFAQRLGEYLIDDKLENLTVDLSIGEFRLTGRVRDIYPNWLLRYRYAGVKAEDRLRAWVQHLALNAARAPGYPAESLLIGLEGKDRKWALLKYAPVEAPRAILETLLTLYWDGLTRPLHFFPKSAWAFAELFIQKGKDRDKAVSAARNKWRPSGDRGFPEADDPYYDRCFGETEPIDEAFEDLAVKVFQPLMASMEN